MKYEEFVGFRQPATLCPYFQPAPADSSYRVGGICPVYRSRHGDHGVEVWLRIEYESWDVSPLDAAA